MNDSSNDEIDDEVAKISQRTGNMKQDEVRSDDIHIEMVTNGQRRPNKDLVLNHYDDFDQRKNQMENARLKSLEDADEDDDQMASQRQQNLRHDNSAPNFEENSFG